MRTVILFIAVLINLPVSGQTNARSLYGIVRDTAGKRGLHNAVIYFKDPQKSTLIAYARSDSTGRFEIKNLPADTLVMVVTYPGYVDWIDSIAPGRKFIDVSVITQAKLLKDFMVTAVKAPVRIKGDTTEFLADYFQMRPDATVEDLLRILPGMSVNAKGQITLHGQTVQQVLVDGEEFFGNDPTMATQNLNKNDISKVQVYDRKTDHANNTGVDDGVRQKTINLVLKEDAKKGYFGELYGGTDYRKYYQGKATISHFTSKSKAGLLFVADRTGRDVAGYSEGDDFGLAAITRQGIPETIQAAGMLNKKFGVLQSSTVNNTAFNHVNVVGENFTGIKYVLPDTVYYSRQASTNKTSAWQQVVNSKNELKLDSFTTLTVNARLAFGKTKTASSQNGQYLASDNTTLVNESEQSNALSGDHSTGNADVYFKRSLNKTGTRLLIINTSYLNSTNNSEGYLHNRTTYDSSGTSISQIVDQKKINTYRSDLAQALLTYVTPLSSNVSLNVNYGLNTENANQNIKSYENRNGKYESLNQLFSNNYKSVNFSHLGGAAFSFSAKKATVTLGFAAQDIKMKQHDLYTDSSMTRNFVNVFPRASIQWKYATSGTASFNYNGKTQQPTFAQLQPVLNNSDPLNIQIGNPDLKPAFYHSFDMQLNQYKAVTGRVIRAGGSFTLARNDFNTFSQIDNQGRRTYQTINVNGNYNYRAWVTYGRSLKFLNLTASIQPLIYGDRFNNYINGLGNTTNVFSFSPTLNINGNIDKVLDIQTAVNVEFRHSVSSINPEMSTNYKVFYMSLYMTYSIKGGWVFNTFFEYNIRQKLSAGDKNNNAMIWHIEAEKRIVQKQNISAILKVNDILNQKIGFNRTITSTSISENTFMTIQRYILISLRWRFNKNRNL